jgi:pumilio RNA-binding family
LAGRHKSLVDLIQEDFPRTPSPVYESRSSSHATTEEQIDHDTSALDISSISISEETKLNVGPADDNLGLASNNNSSSPISQAPENNDTKDETLTGCASSGSDVFGISSRVRNNQGDPQSHMQNVPQSHPFVQQGARYQVQGIQSPVVTSRNPIGEMEKLAYIQPRSYVTNTRPTLPSSGLTAPYYATPAPYVPPGNPFFPNFQPPGLYAPQYGVGGYPLGSPVLPSFISGYPSQGAMSVPLDTNTGPGFDSQNMSVSPGESNMQHLGKCYGHHGLMLQPPFLDPLQMSYLQQHNFGDVYNSSVPPYSRSAASGNQVDAFTSFIGEQKLQRPTGGNYYGVPPDLGGVMTQFAGSPLGSPVLPSSPVRGMNYQRNEIRFPHNPSQKVGQYTGWRGQQRVVNSIDEPKRNFFLEELKSSNSRKFELSDIAGRIVEFSVDQHGSRFIQQKLEQCNMEDKVSVFIEVLPHASKLMTDVFGNYVIQKFFEHGSPEQRRELADHFVGQMLPLSLQMYGCRVIQKALEVIELDQKIKLVRELDGHVMKCVRDQNGNHVIQKCIECLPAEKIGFIITAFRGQISTLSTHPYGCRVIQRILEHGSDELQCQCIIDEILESARILAEDQYGNYVIQHVLERGNPHERSRIINNLTGKIVQMSQHKYASNVIEKCLRYGDAPERERLIDEIIGQSEENDSLLTMMKDQFANYVVQKIFETGTDRQREILLNHIRDNLQALKKYTYGKHIVLRYEQLVGEGE